MPEDVTPKIVFEVNPWMEHDHNHTCAWCETGEAEVYLTVTLHGQKGDTLELHQECKDKLVRVMKWMFG